MKIIVSDVDDVCADLVTEWLKRYNKDWNDNVKKSDLTDWDISLFIKDKNNKKYLYEYIEDPSLYDKIKPIKNSLWGINTLRNFGYRIIFVTSSTSGSAGRKFHWLQDYGFIENKKDYIEAYDKSLIFGDYMIDDKLDNVQSFTGKGILFGEMWGNVWNRKAKNWKEVINLISSEQQIEKEK